MTPELGETSLFGQDGRNCPSIKAGGLADVTALLVDSLDGTGADVHVALPHYRNLLHGAPADRCRQLHLCQDREFFYRRSVYDGSPEENHRAALAFQRDVIHYVLPKVRPDIVHCHDWMTGLVPAAAQAMGIPSLFTLHNLHDERTMLYHVEDRGIDAARFWEKLYFIHYPGSYEANRGSNPLSLLASGILAADLMNTVSPTFLDELSRNLHAARPICDAVRAKIESGHARGILNSLSSKVSPQEDCQLACRYDPSGHVIGKHANKRALQGLLGLEQNGDAPLLFWPSRLDPTQKGCQLLADILYSLVNDYWELGLQVVFVADGPFQRHFRDIANFHSLHQRIAVHSFDERLSRLGYAASDFTLMPSSYEPCGLSQMIALRYGSIPIVHATGGLRDTVSPLADGKSGNGFLFEIHDAAGLRWAIDQALLFFLRPAEAREIVTSRVMTEAAHSFLPSVMVREYVDLYHSLLHEPSE